MYELNNQKKLKKYRSDLRKDQTKAEGVLWSKIRRKTLGYKFRRQHSFGNFILDFYCSQLRLAIEIDGWIHGEDFKIVADKEKDIFLRRHGVKVLRIYNEQVLNNLEGCWYFLFDQCKKRAKSICE